MQSIFSSSADLWAHARGSMLVAWAGLSLAASLFPSVAAEADLANLPPAATRPVEFAKDIEPIFANNCYSCHGPKKQESGLRLDQKAGALKGGDDFGAKAIQPGNSAASVLVQAVAHVHPDLKMPKKGDRLTAEQVGLLRAWIDQGATWPESAVARKSGKDHWAFQAPVRPKVPVVSDRKWVRTPVDNFILAKLTAEKLKPSTEADKVTLLRRLHLDLTGLPPTIADVDAFLADKSKDAYEKVVEKLLASPHYGERWGRHWLDAARYADSDGYEKDMSRQVHFYRDYVVGAFNRDLPYDQFLLEQLAGDQLPNATQEQRVATGFLRNSMLNEEGAIDPEQFRMDAMFDRMDAIGKAMLGLTIQCAQCHNHKYDPIAQEDYYRMFAFINNDHEAFPAVYSPEQLEKVAAIQSGVAEIEADLKRQIPDWEQRMARWEEAVATNQPEWQIVWPLPHYGDNDQRFYELPDKSLLAAGYKPTKVNERFRTTNEFSNISAFRLEVLTDPNLPFGGPGRSFMGTLALSDFVVEAAEARNPTNKLTVKWASATADYDQPEHPLEPNFYDKSTNNRVTGPVRYAIDGNDLTAWGVDAGPGRRNVDRKAVFVSDKPVGFSGGTIFTFNLKQYHGGWNSDDHMNNNIGRFRLSVSTATNAVADPLPKKVRALLADVPRARRNPAQTAAIFSYWRTTVPEWKEANARIDKLMDGWPAATTALTLMAREVPRDTRILKRGDWLKPTTPVSPGVPTILHQLPKDAPPTRLTFAKWLADKKSPTTARVFVNRVWQAYFGTGIVSTPEDLGTQSEAPSHPELLDWLAVEFMEPTFSPSPGAAGEASAPDKSQLGRGEGGLTQSRSAHSWSVKHLHRLIVNSATYRQSSKVSPDLYARDPYNRLLARGSRLRVEGEIVRDIALAASGLPNPKLGGRAVMPPAPDFLFQPPASYAPFPWKNEEGDEKYRRALYTFRRRSTPYPALQTFDVPNADFSCVRRQRSNSPLQALVSLNEPIFVECAQSLARRTLAQGGTTDEARITYAFRCVLSRPPEADEKRELLALLERQKQRLADGWMNASEVATGKSEVSKDLPKGTSPTQLAAYTVVSRVLLNLDETITKE